MNVFNLEKVKRLQSSLSNSKNYVKLDLRNPEHYELYMDSFGGEDNYLASFTYLADTINELKEQHGNYPHLTEINDDEYDGFQGFSDYFSLENLQLDPVTMNDCLDFVGDEPINKAVPKVDLKCQFTEEKESIFARTYFWDVTDKKNRVIVGHGFIEKKNTFQLDDTIVGESFELLSSETREYEIISTVTAAKKIQGSKLYLLSPVKVISNGYTTLDPKEYIEEFKLDAPVIKAENEGKPGHDEVRILYKRQAQVPDPDYIYDEDPFIQDNKELIQVRVPVEVTITAAEGLYIVGLNDRYQFRVAISNLKLPVNTADGVATDTTKGGSVTLLCDFERIEYHISKDGKKIKVIFPTDWENQIDLRKVGYEPFLSLDFLLQLTIDLTRDSSDNPDKFTMPITLQASSETKKINSVLISAKKLYIQWGCFADDTKIKLPNGDSRLAKDIVTGDEVLLASGEIKKVMNIYSGYEEEVFEIKLTNKKTISLSGGHILVTDKGHIRAYRVTKDMLIETDEGLQKVIEVNVVSYQRDVYNFEFDSASIIIGNGVFIGDYMLQNKEVELLEV